MTALLPDDPSLRWDGTLASHEALVEHPTVHAYVAMRVWGKLERHRDVVVAETVARSNPGGAVLALAPGDLRRELFVAERLPQRHFCLAVTSEQQLEDGLRQVRERGLEHVRVVHTPEGRIGEPPQTFEVAICLYAAHRRTDLEELWSDLRAALVPGGTVLAQEYVGPRSFAWPATQCEAANRALANVPSVLRPHHSEVGPALAERLREAEPQAAARSDEVVATCAERFELVAEVGCGCALLHPVLTGQVGTFDPGNWSHNLVLAELFRAEDELMQRGELGDDFAMFIAQAN